MKIDHYFYGWIFFKDFFYIRPGIVIRRASVQLSAHHIESLRHMEHLIPVGFRQDLCQIIAHPDDRIFHMPFPGVRERLLGMAVIDQDLGSPRILLQRQVFFKKSRRVEKLFAGNSPRIHNKKVIQKIIVVGQGFRRQIDLRMRKRGGRGCLRGGSVFCLGRRRNGSRRFLFFFHAFLFFYSFLFFLLLLRVLLRILPVLFFRHLFQIAGVVFRQKLIGFRVVSPGNSSGRLFQKAVQGKLSVNIPAGKKPSRRCRQNREKAQT